MPSSAVVVKEFDDTVWDGLYFQFRRWTAKGVRIFCKKKKIFQPESKLRRQFASARFPGVLGLKHSIQLFKSTALGLDKEKVHKYELKQVPEDKEYVAEIQG